MSSIACLLLFILVIEFPYTLNKPLTSETKCVFNDCKDSNNIERLFLTELLHREPTEYELSNIQNEYDEIEPSKLEDFDILLTPNQARHLIAANSRLESKQRPRRGAVHDSEKFPFVKWDIANGLNPMKYMYTGFSDEEVYWIKNAFDTWQNKTCIRFEEVDTNTSIYEPHLRIQKSSVCSSYVGVKEDWLPYEGQALNLSPSCLTQHTVGKALHEVGHALGLIHEHQRPSRDNHISVTQTQFDFLFKMIFAFNYGKELAEDMENHGTEYDFNSIMHYRTDTFSGHIDTHDVLYNQNIGQRMALSFYDIKVINMEYCSDVCFENMDFECLHGGYQDPNDCSRCRCPDGLSGERCQDIEHNECSSVIYLSTDGTTTIKSPENTEMGYKYPIECNWLIKAPPGYNVIAEFRDEFLIMKNEDDTCHDYVEVNINANLGTPGYRFCGALPPEREIQSGVDQMFIRFHSFSRYDWMESLFLSNGKPGFTLSFHVEEEWIPIAEPSIQEPPLVMHDITRSTTLSTTELTKPSSTTTQTTTPSTTESTTTTSTTTQFTKPSTTEPPTTTSTTTTPSTTEPPTTTSSTTQSTTPSTTESMTATSTTTQSTTPSTTEPTTTTSTTTQSITPSTTEPTTTTSTTTQSTTPSTTESTTTTSTTTTPSTTEPTTTTSTTTQSTAPSTTVPLSISQLQVVSSTSHHSSTISTTTQESKFSDDSYWSDWEPSQTTTCQCGGCNHMIRFRMCGRERCQGEDSGFEIGERILRECTKDDYQLKWVGRFEFVSCTPRGSQCCRGFVDDSNKHGYCREM